VRVRVWLRDVCDNITATPRHQMLEGIQWMDDDNLARSHVISIDRALVAHGGGWGDYQGGAGENYFHTVQALASVAFLLPALAADPGLKLLMHVCKDPWAKIKRQFYAAGAGAETDPAAEPSTEPRFACAVEAHTVELLGILGVPIDRVVHYPCVKHRVWSLGSTAGARA